MQIGTMFYRCFVDVGPVKNIVPLCRFRFRFKSLRLIGRESAPAHTPKGVTWYLAHNIYGSCDESSVIGRRRHVVETKAKVATPRFYLFFC